MDRLNTNIPKWFVMGLILTLCTLCSCSRKVTSHVERTSDTLIIHHSDTLQVYDTIKVISKMGITDSVSDRMTTYVVVDTAGRVLTKYVYRYRSVYHNKDALSASSHTSNQIQHIQTNTTHKKYKQKEQYKKWETFNGILLYLLTAIVIIYFIKKISQKFG